MRTWQHAVAAESPDSRIVGVLRNHLGAAKCAVDLARAERQLRRKPAQGGPVDACGPVSLDQRIVQPLALAECFRPLLLRRGCHDTGEDADAIAGVLVCVECGLERSLVEERLGQLPCLQLSPLCCPPEHWRFLCATGSRVHAARGDCGGQRGDVLAAAHQPHASGPVVILELD